MYIYINKTIWILMILFYLFMLPGIIVLIGELLTGKRLNWSKYFDMYLNICAHILYTVTLFGFIYYFIYYVLGFYFPWFKS